MTDSSKDTVHSHDHVSNDKTIQSNHLSDEILLDAKDKLLNRLEEVSALSMTLSFARDCEHSELPNNVEGIVLGIIEIFTNDAVDATKILKAGGKL